MINKFYIMQLGICKQKLHDMYICKHEHMLIAIFNRLNHYKLIKFCSSLIKYVCVYTELLTTMYVIMFTRITMILWLYICAVATIATWEILEGKILVTELYA